MGSSHSSDYYDFFLVFLHAIHKTVICYPVIWEFLEGNERADSAAKTALQKDVSNCLISYTDTYQYISQYVRDMWQHEWDTAVVVLLSTHSHDPC